ncbi:uncharacterized protein [Eurosta solidaginis]|uniref:uncharacterized protein n=1 Tax=Eurosta solidaginis TaxID=178769 RepID=UPI003530B760
MSNAVREEVNPNETTNVATIFENEFNKKTLFKFLPVIMKGPEGCRKVIAFIDEGSKISLIEEQIAKSVGLKGPADLLSLRWIGGKTTSEVSQRLNIEISSANISTNTFEMRNVRTTKKLELPSQTLDLENFRNKFDCLKNLPVEDYVDVLPQMLIGIPHIQLVRTIEVINLDEHFAVHKAKLGYILFGSNEDSSEEFVCRIDCEQDSYNKIQQQVSEYFTIEDFGVKPLKPIISEADKRAERILLLRSAVMVYGYGPLGNVFVRTHLVTGDGAKVAMQKYRNKEKKNSAITSEKSHEFPAMKEKRSVKNLETTTSREMAMSFRPGKNKDDL